MESKCRLPSKITFSQYFLEQAEWMQVDPKLIALLIARINSASNEERLAGRQDSADGEL